MKKEPQAESETIRLEVTRHKMRENNHCYDDIINLPHPTSKVHPRMPRIDRAAQFAPFAALSGHGEEIQEAARFTEEQMEISEDMKKELDKTFERLVQDWNNNPWLKLRILRKINGNKVEDM